MIEKKLIIERLERVRLGKTQRRGSEDEQQGTVCQRAKHFLDLNNLYYESLRWLVRANAFAEQTDRSTIINCKVGNIHELRPNHPQSKSSLIHSWKRVEFRWCSTWCYHDLLSGLQGCIMKKFHDSSMFSHSPSFLLLGVVVKCATVSAHWRGPIVSHVRKATVLLAHICNK